MQVDLRPRSFGELVGQSLALSAVHFARLFPITILLSAPGVALEMYQKRLIETDPGLAIAVMLGGLLLNLMVWPLGTAVAMKIVAGSYTGTPCSIKEGVQVGLRRLFPLLGASFAVSIICGLGALLLLVPGLMAMTAFYVVPCAVVLEGLGVGASMRRSRDLTRGHRWRVFAVILVLVFLAQIVPGIGLAAVTEQDVQNPGVFVLTTLVIAAFTVPSTIAPVVVFFDLRVRKEAFDVTMLGDLVAKIGARVRRGATRPLSASS